MSERITANSREIIAAQSTIDGKVEYLTSTLGALNVNGSFSITGGATSANQTSGAQKTQIVDGSGNVIGSTSNALDVNIKSSGTVTISGSVTANAGTNLNTSALALESGGNLATIAGAVTSSTVQTNLKQVNGVATQTGTGVAGTGTQRVAVASDSSITANAGTNLNTSALALDATLTGGTQTSRLTDGTNTATVKAASTAPIATDTAAVVSLSPNGRTVLLAAGTNLAGKVGIDQTTVGTTNGVSLAQIGANTVSSGNGASGTGVLRVAQVSDGTGILATVTSLTQFNGNAISTNTGAVGAGVIRTVEANDAGKTLKSAGGSAASSGNNTLVAAGTNKLKVFGFSLTTTSTSSTTCIFQSGASGTELWRVVLQAPTSVNVGANLVVTPPAYLFTTASATLLNLNLSGANTIHWSVAYFDEA